MECRIVENLISAYLENDLDKEQLAMVEIHLQDCPTCLPLKKKMEGLVSRLPDLEAEIPFFLKNRLYNIPEHIEKNRPSRIFFPKWAAAVMGSVILFLNLFYFTNLFPPANREIHSLVADVERMIVRTGGWIEKIKESKDFLIFTFFNKKSLAIRDEGKEKNKVDFERTFDKGG